jgi:flavin-dependent dehydrogenase
MRRGYELYVTPLPDSEVTVAALAHADLVPGNLRAAFRNWCQAETRLCSWLEGSTPTSELLGRAPLLQHGGARAVPPGLILLGDAERSVDPITAGGMSLALTSAELLARYFPAILRGDARARRRFESERARAVRRHRVLGSGLLALSKHPLAARAAGLLMQAHPATMSRLVEFAAARTS